MRPRLSRCRTRRMRRIRCGSFQRRSSRSRPTTRSMLFFPRNSWPAVLGRSSLRSATRVFQFSGTGSLVSRVCFTRRTRPPSRFARSRRFLYLQTRLRQNLGFGRWLILARSDDFSLQVFNSTPGALEIPPIPGCQSCIITLACGTEVSTESLYLRSDIASCAHVGARRLQLRLPTPLHKLFAALPPVHEYPSLPAAQSDRLELFREVQFGLSTLKHSELRPEIIAKISQPLTEEYLKKTADLQFRRIGLFDIWRASLIVGVSSFLISLALLACTGGFLYWSLLKVAETVPEEEDENAKESRRTPGAAPAHERRHMLPYAALRHFLYNPPPPQYSAEMQPTARAEAQRLASPL